MPDRTTADRLPAPARREGRRLVRHDTGARDAVVRRFHDAFVRTVRTRLPR